MVTPLWLRLARLHIVLGAEVEARAVNGADVHERHDNALFDQRREWRMPEFIPQYGELRIGITPAGFPFLASG